MKKLLTSIAALLVSAVVTSASAQAVMYDDSFPWRFGVQLGFNVPSFGESGYNSTIGWNFGATAIYDLQNFIPNSYGRLGVTYTRKGANMDDIYYPEKSNPLLTFKSPTCYIHYLEVPAHFGWAYELDGMPFDMCIMAETGPYFSFRMWDSQYTEDKVTVSTQGVNIPNYSMEDAFDDLRRFDVGWGIHAGVLLDKKYQFMIGYDWGLCDAVPDVTGGNRNLTFNLSVYFD